MDTKFEQDKPKSVETLDQIMLNWLDPQSENAQLIRTTIINLMAAANIRRFSRKVLPKLRQGEYLSLWDGLTVLGAVAALGRSASLAHRLSALEADTTLRLTQERIEKIKENVASAAFEISPEEEFEQLKRDQRERDPRRWTPGHGA